MKSNTKDKAETLKEQILEKIRSGEYPVGGKLPSVRSLVREFGVCQFTVSRTLTILSENGIIRLEPKKAPVVLHCPAKHQIQLICWELNMQNNIFWGEFFRGICDEIKQYPDYDLLLNPQKSFPVAFGEQSGKVSGTIIMGSPYVEFQEFAGPEHPIVYVYDYPLNRACKYVSSDYSPCMKEIVNQFVKSGCRELAWCGWNDKDGINIVKLNLLEKYAAEYGLSFRKEHKFFDGLSHDDIYTQVKEACGGKNPVDAIVLLSDQLIQPVLRAVHDAHKNIPGDIKIVGCDNLTDSKFMIPALTTVELDRYQQGRLAVEKVVRMIENPEDSVDSVLLPVKLIYRETFTKSAKNRKKNEKFSFSGGKGT